ncbi:MAG TPA: hypothetical protein VFY78_03435 [Gammaproteobacteria bacterium]|nr:hypothetical protein [Gammaproteobacteria bacterium]
MLIRIAALATMLFVFMACSSKGVTVNSIPGQPRIVSGHLHGQRVCDEFRTTDQLFNFTCAAFPTHGATGWQLSPLDIETLSTSNDIGVRTNLFVAIVIETPTMTRLKVMFKNTAMTAVDAKPNALPITSVGHHGEYVVSTSDDGTHKTWTLIFRVNPCMEASEVNIFNMSLDGASRSNPLSVVFLRAPTEVRENCGGLAVSGTPTQPPVTGTSLADPTTPSTPALSGGPCNGQAEQQFTVCEVCAHIPAVSGVSGCSFAEALLNYNLPNAGCYVNQVSDSTQCIP